MGFNGIGMTELIIVLVIALIVLGPKRLPEAGRSLGRGMREFKESLSGGKRRDDEDDDDFDAIDAPRSSSSRTSTSAETAETSSTK
jgi:sec-independent protein translocase protein TatA